MGDVAFREKARALDKALREAISSAGGSTVEGKLLGDGVLAVFGAAREAITCSGSCHAAAQEAGLEVVDARTSGGALWVIGGPEIEQILSELDPFAGEFKFAPSGRTITGGRPAWYTYHGTN